MKEGERKADKRYNISTEPYNLHWTWLLFIGLIIMFSVAYWFEFSAGIFRIYNKLITLHLHTCSWLTCTSYILLHDNKKDTAFVIDFNVLYMYNMINFEYLLTLFLAQTVTLNIKSSDVTYVQLGNTLKLDVSYTYTGRKTVIVDWLFNDASIVGKIGDVIQKGSDPRATIRGQATFVLQNTTLSDNGTYTVEVFLIGGVKQEKRFQVIIQGNVSIQYSD